jgi:hypothetical protein
MGESLTVEVAQACQRVKQKKLKSAQKRAHWGQTRHTALKRHKPLSTRMTRAPTRT